MQEACCGQTDQFRSLCPRKCFHWNGHVSHKKPHNRGATLACSNIRGSLYTAEQLQELSASHVEGDLQTLCRFYFLGNRSNWLFISWHKARLGNFKSRFWNEIWPYRTKNGRKHDAKYRKILNLPGSSRTPAIYVNGCLLLGNLVFFLGTRRISWLDSPLSEEGWVMRPT